MISKKQKILLAALVAILLLIWAAIFFVDNYRVQYGEVFEYAGEKYNVEFEESKADLFNKQGAILCVRRKSEETSVMTSVIRIGVRIDNNGEEYTQDNCKVTFEDEYISVELINNSGILCGSYQFYYDQLDSII